jgi:hypothetical protein
MQDTQIMSSTIIDHKIYSITNLDNKSGGIAFMAINILIAINLRQAPSCNSYVEGPVFE